MKLKYIFYIIFSGIAFSCFSQNYSITWQRTIGGTNTDKLTKMITTSDGGMVLCGHSNSNISGSKKDNSIKNSYDYWIVRLNKFGQTLWAKTYGGSDRDLYPNIIQTSDGGFLVGGSSISPASGSKTENAINQSFDYWVIKLDSLGNKIWDNTIGGIQFEKLSTVLEAGNSYYICGSSNSIDSSDKTVNNEGSSLWPDYWIVKLNKSGRILWDSVYGGTNRDELTSAKVTSDGGILLGGYSYSPRSGNKQDDFIGNNDYWLVRLDSSGHKLLDKTIGGSLSDYLTSIDLVGNAGYVLAGYSNSPASFNKTESCRGGTDYWIIRTDRSGNVLWDKTYGGAGLEYATSVKFLTGGQYLVGGYSNSGISGDKTVDSIGGMDFWTLILDKTGNLIQQNVWGGTGDDYLTDYTTGDSSNYILAGTSSSPKSGNKSNPTVGNTGNPDYWVFKISPTGSAFKQTNQSMIADSKVEDIKTRLSLNISPNPVKDVLNINYSVNTNQPVTLSVYSNDGKLINQQTLSQSSGNYTLNVSAQNAGLYYAIIQSGTSSITRKFVKN